MGSHGNCKFVHMDALQPPPEWHGAFCAVVDKGLADSLLFGRDMDSALDRAVRYGAAVDDMLRPGGVLLQLSDAPIELRREMLEIIWGVSVTERRWAFDWRRTGDGELTLLVAH